MSAVSGTAEERLRSFLAGGGRSAGGYRSLSGDASTRRYFRLTWGGETAVAAVYPEPFDASRHSFLAVHALLEEWGIPVPSLLAVDGATGVIVLEDLGDTTLQERLREVDSEDRERLYGEAIDSILTLQRAARQTAGDYECFGLAFDTEKLAWEMDFFLKHFVAGLRGVQLRDDERWRLTEELGRLCTEIASWPRVLCHRDYHSRNLMWHRGRLVWLDYQDARMGPTTYDLASLLCDAYVDVGEPLLSHSLTRWRRGAESGETEVAFRRRFDLTAAQRTLKALGTFGYQASVRGKSTYLEYVPRTLDLARISLARCPELSELHRLLAGHLEELRS